MSESPRTSRQNTQSVGERPRTTQTTESLSSMLQSLSKTPASRQRARTEPKDGGQVPNLYFISDKWTKSPKFVFKSFILHCK